MNAEDNTALKATAGPAPDATELLQRILTAVEPAQWKPWFELACAMVLALATTASAWCASPAGLSGVRVVITRLT